MASPRKLADRLATYFVGIVLAALLVIVLFASAPRRKAETGCKNARIIDQHTDPSRGVTETMYLCDDGTRFFNSQPFGLTQTK